MRKKKTKSIKVRCGHGNIIRIGKSFRARMMVDGKLVSQNCPTEDAAQAFLEGVAKRTLGYGMPLDKTKITWHELGQSFIQAKELQEIKKTTLSDYRRCLRYCAEWDGTPATQITADHVRALLAKLKKGIGTRTPLCGKTLNNHFSTIHAILDLGVRDQILERNVADLVDRPRIDPPPPHALAVSEIERFLKALEGERTEALFWVILATGLRKGEAVGLKWDDVNLKTGVITVKRRLVRVDGEIDVDTPKSRAGMRTVQLPVQALEKLKAWQVRQDVEKNAYESTWRNEGWIFTTPKGGSYAGKYLEPRTVNDYLDQILAKAELPHATVHDLRHTFCTWLLSQGVSVKDVQEAAGHSRPSVTYNMYYASIPGASERVAKKLEGMLDLS
jgi:integrase